jgi:hypothetical protein
VVQQIVASKDIAPRDEAIIGNAFRRRMVEAIRTDV